jgi:hypothetical protein
MVPPDLWLEVLSWVKTLFELTKSSVDLLDLKRTHQKYRRDPETIREARRASVQFQTFSEAEVESLLDRIQGCRDRFISQGAVPTVHAASAVFSTRQEQATAASFH